MRTYADVLAEEKNPVHTYADVLAEDASRLDTAAPSAPQPAPQPAPTMAPGGVFTPSFGKPATRPADSDYQGFLPELGKITKKSALDIGGNLLGGMYRKAGMATLGTLPGGITIPFSRQQREELKRIYDEPLPAAQALRDKAAAIQPAKDGGFGGYMANVLGSTIPYMGGSVASMVASGGNPMAPYMFMSTVEDEGAYRSGREQSATPEQAGFEGVITGTMNGLIENLQLHGIVKLGKAAKKELTTVAAKAVRSKLGKLGRITKDALTTAMQEGLEESLQGTVSETVPYLTRGQKPDEGFLTRRGQEFVGGAIAGTLFGMASTPFNRGASNAGVQESTNAEVVGAGEPQGRRRVADTGDGQGVDSPFPLAGKEDGGAVPDPVEGTVGTEAVQAGTEVDDAVIESGQNQELTLQVEHEVIRSIRKQIADLADNPTEEAFKAIPKLIQSIRRHKIKYNTDKSKGATTIKLTAPNGMYAIISPSAKQAGKWQITRFDDKGAVEDTVRDTQKEALELISGAKFGTLDFSDNMDFLVTETDKDAIASATGTEKVQAGKSEPEEEVTGTALNSQQYPILEVPVRTISLSQDVPNFKEDAKRDTGVVKGAELQGKYERLGTAPIIVWQRKNGKLEVITGRHRYDLAIRTGEQTIPAQIVKESEGFDLDDALTIDAESNIRDGQGSLKDYAQYFRNTKITEEEAGARGLLSRAKGKEAFIIGKGASDDVYTGYLSGQLAGPKAYQIAKNAPNNDVVQIAAAAKAKDMSADQLGVYTAILSRTSPSAKATQGDLFGWDDSAIQEAEAVAKVVSQEIQQVKEKILSVKAALRRPDTARNMGLEFSNETETQAEVDRLEEYRNRLEHATTDPEIYQEMRKKAGLTNESDAQTPAPTEVAAPLEPSLATGAEKAVGGKRHTSLPAKKAKVEPGFELKNDPAKQKQETIPFYEPSKLEKSIEDRPSIEDDKNQGNLFSPSSGMAGNSSRGSTILLNELASEMIEGTQHAARSVKHATRGASDIAKRIFLRGSKWTESLGESGKKITSSMWTIDRRASQRAKNNEIDIRKIITGLSKRQREFIAKTIEGRTGKAKVPQWVSDKVEKLVAILDRDMLEARSLKMTRVTRGGKRILVGGSGRAFPQVPNDKGMKFLDDAAEKGLADPAVYRMAEQMVEGGKAKTVEAALRRIQEYRESVLRGETGYLERSRKILLPDDMREWDPVKVLPALLEKTAMTVEGVREWGNDFEKLAPLLEEVRLSHGGPTSDLVKQFIQMEFGKAGLVPSGEAKFWNAASNYQTMTKLGFSVLSSLRNMGQRYTNTSMYPLSVQLKATLKFPPFFNMFMRSTRQLKKDIERTGAVRSATFLSDIESNAPGQRITAWAMKLFSAVETGNQTYTALVARYGLERDLNLLLKHQKDSSLANKVNTIISLGDQSDAAIARRLKKGGLDNLNNEQVADVLEKIGKNETPDELLVVMHRLVTDTQFPMTMMTRRVWWRNHPALRLMFKFKTFGIEQVGHVYKYAASEAVKGNVVPMMRCLLWFSLMGELYNILRDYLYGHEESITRMLIDDPSKRTAKDVAWHLAKNIADGGGVGILADLVWGIGDSVLGPAWSTAKNVAATTSDIIHKPAQTGTAVRKFLGKEIAVSRQLDGILNRIDKQFVNQNNRVIDYAKWRSRTYEWKDKKETGGTVGGAVKKMALETIYGKPGYERSSRTLSYEYAARQITAGDIDDAADYIRRVLAEAKTPQEKAELLKSIKLSMRSKSPLGAIAQKDWREFLSQYPADQRDEIKTLHKEWSKDYYRAIRQAYKK